MSNAIVVLTLALLAGLVHATPIPIQNAGFETANLTLNGNGTFSQLVAGSTIFVAGGSLSNWTVANSNLDAAAGAFAPSPGGNNWTSTWWSGNNIGCLQQSSAGTVSLSQVLSENLLNDTTYTLSALIGRRSFTPNFNYSLQLFAGSTLLQSASNLALASNSSGSDSLTFSSGSNNALAGQTLMVRFSTTSTGGFTESFFDNVELDAVTAGVPEPSSIAYLFLAATAMLAARVRAR